MSKVIISTDGASQGNPGDAGIGVVISAEDGTILCEIGEYIGKTTNNVAEYSALVRGLQEALKLGATQVEINMDSELMARQLAGVYKVKSELLKPLYTQAMTILLHFKSAKISHVMREFNKRADELANEGIKKHKNSFGKKKSKPVSITTDMEIPEQPKKQQSQGELEF